MSLLLAQDRSPGKEEFRLSPTPLTTWSPCSGGSTLRSSPASHPSYTSRYTFLYFFLPPGAIKFPQLSFLAHWAWAVGANRKEGVPVFQ